jgi:hypothetical protein
MRLLCKLTIAIYIYIYCVYCRFTNATELQRAFALIDFLIVKAVKMIC